MRQHSVTISAGFDSRGTNNTVNHLVKVLGVHKHMAVEGVSHELKVFVRFALARDPISVGRGHNSKRADVYKSDSMRHCLSFQMQISSEDPSMCK